MYETSEYLSENLYEINTRKIRMINDIIKQNVEDMEYFVEEIRNMGKMPKQADEENQYRILSFPWCISGHLLTNIKFLNTN